MGSTTAPQLIVIGAFAFSILGLLFGPKHLFGKARFWGAGGPPWFLSNVVYAPIVGVALLSLAHVALGWFGLTFEPFVTGTHIAETVTSKYDIVFLILSFAYLSISLDRSGFFEFASFKIVLYSGGHGTRLLVFFYLLCSVLTFFTSNDIVIISMTPIILYVGKHAGIRNLVPLLISQFVAANTLSMGLYIGSPTNIVLGDATAMTFVDYFLWMFLPSVVSCVVTLGMLLVVFRLIPIRGNRIQERFQVPDRARDIRSSRPMWIKVVIFAVCLAFLTASSFLGLELWTICLVTAVVMLAYDLILLRGGNERVGGFFAGVGRRMPWPIAPFVLSFFTLVKALSRSGFTESAANVLVDLGQGSLLKLSLVFGYVSAITVNLMNDIPSTVFWADMVPHLQELLTEEQYRVTVYSLIVGVNPGCYLTLIGALAGLMWINIIKTWPGGDPGKTPTGWDLTTYGVLIIVPVIFFTCLSVVLEVQLFASTG
jgi:arsenical pump membrane protein